MSAFLFFSGIKVHGDAMWLSDKHSLQYVALSMMDRASELAISEDNASEDVAGD